jgi:multisubunit Na+/H+ antiporter MnhC subunit
MMLSTWQIILIGMVGLLAVALYTLLAAQHLIRLIIGLQLLGKAAILGLAAAGEVSGQPVLGETLALTVIVADTIVAVIGLALAVQVQRRFGTLDVRVLAGQEE